MKNLISLFALVAFVGLMSFSPSMDQEIEYSTVEYIKENATELDASELKVFVKGHILEKESRSHYKLEDATGDIIVKIEWGDFPHFDVEPEREVTVVGEVNYYDDDDDSPLYIDVERLLYTDGESVRSRD